MATDIGTAPPVQAAEAEPEGDEGGSQYVSLGAARTPTVEAGGPSETANLVSMFDEAEQKKIVSTVCDDYDADVKSREPRMRRLKQYIGLHASIMKAKTAPFQNCANVNLPILTYPTLQVEGRLFDMIWPANGKVLYCSPTAVADMARAQTAEIFANAYIRNKMPEMPQGLDDTLFQMCIFGSAFRRTYWNSYQTRICSDWIPVEDFVVAHSQRSQDPSMRDVPRYTMVQHMTYYDLVMYGDRAIYENTDKIKPLDPVEKKQSELKDQLEKLDGSGPSNESTDEDKPRMVLEQHRTWVLPVKPEGYPWDGKPHAVIITVDNESQALLSLVVREEPDPDDYERFTKAKTAYDGHVQNLQAFVEQQQAEQSAKDQAQQMGVELPPGIVEDPLPPPAPPGLQTDDTGMPIAPEEQRMREICFFTHYRAFPSEGFYGLGLGDFLAGLNMACNTLVNQHIDGVTFRNSKPFFYSRNMKGQRGTINMAPGQGVEVDAPMGSIKDGIYFPDVPGNDPTTMPLIKMLMESADRLVASSDMMSGQTSGANRTAKEAQILAEQMMMQITVLARRVKEAFCHELMKIWRCFGVFLPDEEIVDVIGHDGDPTNLTIGRDLFRPDAHITPAADPRTKTERVQEAQGLFQFISTNPYLMAQQQFAKDTMMRAATEEILNALGATRFVKLLPPPPQPPPPPEPPQPMQYFEEDANFLQNKPHPVLPGDDDLEHLHGHEAFVNTPGGKTMSKEMKLAHEQHIRDHHAGMIRKTAQRQQPMMGPPQAASTPIGAMARMPAPQAPGAPQ